MPIVMNYGLHWSREGVQWGYYGQRGSLQGYRMQGKEPFIVNFRHQLGIYLLFDKNWEVVYLGQTGLGEQGMLQRLKQHTRETIRERWTYFSWYGFKGVNRDGSLREQDAMTSRSVSLGESLHEIEAVLLASIEPPLNKRGANWKSGEGRRTDEYYQYIPWDWSEDYETIENQMPVSHDTGIILEKLESLQDRIARIEEAVEQG